MKKRRQVFLEDELWLACKTQSIKYEGCPHGINGGSASFYIRQAVLRQLMIDAPSIANIDGINIDIAKKIR